MKKRITGLLIILICIFSLVSCKKLPGDDLIKESSYSGYSYQSYITDNIYDNYIIKTDNGFKSLLSNNEIKGNSLIKLNAIDMNLYYLDDNKDYIYDIYLNKIELKGEYKMLDESYLVLAKSSKYYKILTGEASRDNSLEAFIIRRLIADSDTLVFYKYENEDFFRYSKEFSKEKNYDKYLISADYVLKKTSDDAYIIDLLISSNHSFNTGAIYYSRSNRQTTGTSVVTGNIKKDMLGYIELGRYSLGYSKVLDEVNYNAIINNKKYRLEYKLYSYLDDEIKINTIKPSFYIHDYIYNNDRSKAYLLVSNISRDKEINDLYYMVFDIDGSLSGLKPEADLLINKLNTIKYNNKYYILDSNEDLILLFNNLFITARDGQYFINNSYMVKEGGFILIKYKLHYSNNVYFIGMNKILKYNYKKDKSQIIEYKELIDRSILLYKGIDNNIYLQDDRLLIDGDIKYTYNETTLIKNEVVRFNYYYVNNKRMVIKLKLHK